jgi:hypothetical protein
VCDTGTTCNIDCTGGAPCTVACENGGQLASCNGNCTTSGC